jgi:hypothetical protein
MQGLRSVSWSYRRPARRSRNNKHWEPCRCYGFRHAATAVLFGIIGVALITLAGARLNVTMFPSPGVGPGAISLVYLVVVLFVSHAVERVLAGEPFFASSSAVRPTWRRPNTFRCSFSSRPGSSMCFTSLHGENQ